LKENNIKQCAAMGYVCVKRMVLILILLMTAAGTVFAQNNAQAMKLLTVDALMEYGRTLYNRGDYSEAQGVFKHVLAFDGHQQQALQYLKDMEKPAVRSETFVAKPKAVGMSAPDLKKAIADEKQIIWQLQDQITRMKDSMASASSEGRVN
jgi:tetratricopeptide (TPR) repeat protein